MLSRVQISMTLAMPSKPTWDQNYLPTKCVPAEVTHDVLAEMIKDSAEDEDTGFVVVDVRRTDFEEHAIKNALNIPAQSFYLGLSTWSKVFGDRTVIFHCSSSNGRGNGLCSYVAR